MHMETLFHFNMIGEMGYNSIQMFLQKIKFLLEYWVCKQSKKYFVFVNYHLIYNIAAFPNFHIKKIYIVRKYDYCRMAILIPCLGLAFLSFFPF